MTASPTMTPRELPGFSDWYVVIAWPDGSQRRVNGFTSEAHAKGWIAHESAAWLAQAERKGK